MRKWYIYVSDFLILGTRIHDPGLVLGVDLCAISSQATLTRDKDLAA